MSHFTRVRTEVADRGLLIDALKEMGFEVAENVAVRGWGNQTARADIVARGNSGFDIGFRRSSPDQSFELVADWMGLDMSQAEFQRRLKQEYASAGAIRGAKQKGLTEITKKYTEDGEIEIVAQGY